MNYNILYIFYDIYGKSKIIYIGTSDFSTLLSIVPAAITGRCNVVFVMLTLLYHILTFIVIRYFSKQKT